MADFKTSLVKQSVLSDITDELDYAVMSGASSNTYQQFNAVSSSASAITFNLQVPSENIVVNREVLVQSDIYFTVNITNVTVGQNAFKYGAWDSLQAFPLNSLFTTSSAQINNTNVSVNLQDILPQILRLNNNRELYRYNGMTPSQPDQLYYNFDDAIGNIGSPLSDITGIGLDGDFAPRGAYSLLSTNIIHQPAGGGATDDSLVSTDLTDTWKIELGVRVTEPVMGLSPFIFGDGEYNKQGLVGVNAMSFVFNIDSTCKRFFSSATRPTNAFNQDRTMSVSLGTTAKSNPFENTRMLVNFLSTQPSDLIPARNVCPYHDFPRYLSLQSSVGNVNAGASATLNSQNIQINQLPDYFIVCVRKPMSSQTIQDSSSFFKINSISCNLNNSSGLLSSALPEDLWRISQKNGSQQSWIEFSAEGLKTSSSNTDIADDVSTTGSLLVLSPAFDLSLPDYLSNGSIGQYNFQMQLNVTNQSSSAITPEICIVCVNSGVFTTIAGSSSIFTGILTKQMVLSTKQEEAVDPVSSAMYKRMVGGNLCNMVASAMKKMPRVKAVAEKLAGNGVMSASGMQGNMSALDKLCM